MLFTWPGTVHPEPFDSPFVLSLSKGERLTQDMLVEGCVANPFMLRQAQHERLNPQRPYNCGPISIYADSWAGKTREINLQSEEAGQGRQTESFEKLDQRIEAGPVGYTYKCSAEDCLGGPVLLLVMVDPGSIYGSHPPMTTDNPSLFNTWPAFSTSSSEGGLIPGIELRQG